MKCSPLFLPKRLFHESNKGGEHFKAPFAYYFNLFNLISLEFRVILLDLGILRIFSRTVTAKKQPTAQ